MKKIIHKAWFFDIKEYSIARLWLSDLSWVVGCFGQPLRVALTRVSWVSFPPLTEMAFHLIWITQIKANLNTLITFVLSNSLFSNSFSSSTIDRWSSTINLSDGSAILALRRGDVLSRFVEGVIVEEGVTSWFSFQLNTPSIILDSLCLLHSSEYTAFWSSWDRS